MASAASAAAELGLGFDLTLGSGWPGGLPTARVNAERQLVMGTLEAGDRTAPYRDFLCESTFSIAISGH